MPRKTGQTKTKTKVEDSGKETKSFKNKSEVSKKKVSKKKVNVEKEPDVSEPDVSEPDVSSHDSKERKNRRVPTKETVNESFDELISSIEEEIRQLRESNGKTKGVKFLRSLGKRIKVLRGHAFRVMKQKQKTNRKNNTNSGFLKPVQLSKEMAKFTGWDHSELKSRVDVTKYICKYIRDNNLQNPDDRRQIIADKKLAKLLDYDPESDKPLTYYRIQSYMKKHFSNPS